MSQTAKVDPALEYAMDDEVMDEMENEDATDTFEFRPDPEFLTDSDILEDDFLDSIEDFDVAEVLEKEFSFVLGED